MSEELNHPEAALEPVVAVSEVPVGEVLRQARVAKGLEVAEIAQMLKLGYKQVEALESGEWQALPGQTFIRGFVRNYARLVQIDPQPLMDQLVRVLDKPGDNLAMHEAEPSTLPQAGARISRRDRSVVLIGIGLVLVAAIAYFLMPSDLSALRGNMQSLLDSLAKKEEPAVVQPPANPSEVTPPASEPAFPPGVAPQQAMYPQALTPAEAPPQESAAPVPNVTADVKKVDTPVAPVNSQAPQLRFVLEKASWVEVRDRDNKAIFSQSLSAGTEQTVSGQGPLSIKIGNAPGVKLFWHGESVDLAPHSKGDVARLVLE